MIWLGDVEIEVVCIVMDFEVIVIVEVLVMGCVVVVVD